MRTPQDVVDMERYKNNLLLEMGNIQEKMNENKKQVFFLMRNDKMFEEDTWALIKSLHEWPDKLNDHMDKADERHRKERDDIEIEVLTKKREFEDLIASSEEQYREAEQWYDLYQYRLYMDKVYEM